MSHCYKSYQSPKSKKRNTWFATLDIIINSVGLTISTCGAINSDDKKYKAHNGRSQHSK